ncbi:N-acetyl-gamma-glutamyl-phosphate reductase [Fundidesulfovibrio magnetotacticus]|uniref:N-acetyl-gamma-glutamyl-phosphate reductase n=1 Tax=Fundidesulfovibrio magnetotacticus TaxID=2730080 RepID=A0A6V8LUJ0_9BACT|nr:N-acetyl-gamma-glutamyl-phosphate reductase [Fundidesulfovibrio magnetotacticus]GFK93988.1 N-acetyl-gamma-glutamyl-phosphate reductase [Fundidesulfovibrio magnetotacticus]
MSRIPVGLVGVTGYTGMELARLLAFHPRLDLVRATSRTDKGKPLQEIYPFVRSTKLDGLVLTEPDPQDLARACELVFLAVPHGAAMDTAAELLAQGLKVVDLSADFRLRDPGVYAQWYGLEHRHPGLIGDAVYGLPERYAPDIAKARLIANPGCYPTSVILGLWPALEAGIVEPAGIVCDSKSGTSGAGRKAGVATLFCEIHDTFRAYGLGTHRHTPEIEQELGFLAGQDMTVSFNPHILPIDRGIHSTIYTRLKGAITQEGAAKLYAEHYAGHPWVRVLPPGKLPETRHVRGTMYCDIGVVVDPRTGRLIVCSVIDNLCRGASGQALACANLMLGLDVDEGLRLAPLMP